MAETRVQESFVYTGFGFPVVLRNVPMVRVRDVWTPLVNYNEVAREVLLVLASKSSRLTGAEIRFVRQSFKMTLQAFGVRLDVSHAAVLKWERSGDECPAIKWPTEKDIRLLVLDKLSVPAEEFKRLYDALRNRASRAPEPLEMDMATAA